MNNHLTLILFLFCFSTYSFAQHSPNAIIYHLQQDNSKGKVQIIQDSRFGTFLNQIIEINSTKGTIPGYKIIIFSQSGNKAIANGNAAKSKFVTNFPDIDAEMRVDSPNIFVEVGNFRTHTEALRLKKQIATLFPSARIVPANISINKL